MEEEGEGGMRDLGGGKDRRGREITRVCLWGTTRKCGCDVMRDWVSFWVSIWIWISIFSLSI